MNPSTTAGSKCAPVPSWIIEQAFSCGIAGLYLNLALFQGKAEVFRTVVWSLGGYVGFDLVKVGLAVVLAAPLRQALADHPAGRAELVR